MFVVFELLFIVGMIVWMTELLFEFLSDLAVFPTLLTALLAIPALTYFQYSSELTKQFLSGVSGERAPIPPEAFRWSLVQPKWKREMLWSLLALPFGWLPTFWLPARGEFSLSSGIGWICGALAIYSSAILLSRMTLYFQVAQWFDKMTPRIAGWFWNVMYRLSDNPEFLPDKKEPEIENVLR